jgi:hypothetical protein
VKSRLGSGRAITPAHENGNSTANWKEWELKTRKRTAMKDLNHSKSLTAMKTRMQKLLVCAAVVGGAEAIGYSLVDCVVYFNDSSYMSYTFRANPEA